MPLNELPPMKNFCIGYPTGSNTYDSSIFLSHIAYHNVTDVGLMISIVTCFSVHLTKVTNTLFDIFRQTFATQVRSWVLIIEG